MGATFVMLMTSSGLGFYALTLYLRTLTEVRGFSVSSVSGATAVFFVMSGIVGVGVGRVIARRDPRPVIAVCATIAAASLIGIGRASSLWQVYLAYAGFGAGFAGCSLIISSTLVTRWFHRRRSVALSVSSTGLSVGGILLTPAATALIDDRGFASATLWLAAVFLVGVVPITALLLRPDPIPLGLLPDGDPAPVGAAAASAASGGVPYAEAVRGVLFRRITLAWTLALIAQVGGISHLFSVVDERVDRSGAALAVSVLAGSSMIGRLAGGWLLGRVALRPACLTWLVLQACGLTGLAAVEGRLGLLVSASVFGLSVGNVLLLQPVVLADVFGVRDYPRIFATSQLVSTVGIASGPFVLGILRDATDGYLLAYLAATTLSLAASVVVATGGRLDRFEARPSGLEVHTSR
ncbi:MAG: MFS transporter [Actinomycetota bacterium]|nr:MFS transporter [Actinomycetota bacterium]